MSYAAQITALESALASGALEVRHADGRRVTYRSVSELQNAIAYLRAQEAAQAQRPAVGVSVGTFDRG